MLGGHHDEVDAPLLDGIPRLVLANGGHGEVGLVGDATFAARIRCHVHRPRPCIIPGKRNMAVPSSAIGLVLARGSLGAE